MRVINKNQEETRRLKCHCGVELEYDKSDVRIGAYGCGYIDCPVCGEEILLDDEGINLTIDNVKFPQHFAHAGDKAVKLDDKKIQEWVRKALQHLQKADADYGEFTFFASGDTCCFGMKFEDEYMVVVARNYYDVSIPKDRCPKSQFVV